MLPLNQRKKAREYRSGVNSGNVDDVIARTGMNADSSPYRGGATEVLHAQGKALPDGATPLPAEDEEITTAADDDTATGNDYTKLRTHVDLDAALAGRPAPEGWANLTVADKQKWLIDNSGQPGISPAPAPAPAWGNPAN